MRPVKRTRGVRSSCAGELDPQRATWGVALDLMAPEADDRPTGSLESHGLLAVAFDVPVDLRVPVVDVAGWPAAALRTSMPKAAIDEHRELEAGKREVGPGSLDA
jgi:hypothetical protein